MKKKLLLFWGNPYIFYESILPIIPKLAEKFTVYLMLIDISMLPEHKKAVESFKSEGKIEDYWIVPSPRDEWKDLFEHHFYIKKHLEEWRRKEFDVFLTSTGSEVLDRYLIECVLAPKAIKICFSPCLTNLMKDDKLVRRLLKLGDNNVVRNNANKAEKKRKSLKGYIVSGWFRLRSYFHDINKNMRLIMMHRWFIPFLLVGKMFNQSKNERRALLSARGIDGMAFTDEIEGAAYSAFYPSIRTFVVNYPSLGACRCERQKEEKPAILVPLTTGLCSGEKVADEMLEMLTRDLKNILQQTSARIIHLRLHPRETSNWPYHLRERLLEQGIDVICVKSDRPYREIMCDYLGLASLASNSLRDACAACNNALIIGLLGPSNRLGFDIKFWFGKGEGIGWIEEDGSYDPKIFEKRGINKQRSLGIEELLEDLAYEK